MAPCATTQYRQALAALLGQLQAGALEPAGTIDVSVPSAVVLR